MLARKRFPARQKGGNTLKRLAYLAVLLAVLCSPIHAQQKATLSAQTTDCTVANSCLSVPLTIVGPTRTNIALGAATITVSANASANTLQFEACSSIASDCAANTGWYSITSTQNSASSTTQASSTTSTGWWQFNVGAFTNIRVRCSTFVSGSATVTITTSPASAKAGGGGGGGATGAPTLVTANLIGDYRFTEGSGTTDVDVSGVSGPLTLVNSPTWVTGGGVACTAASSHSITVPTSITTSAISVELYVNVQYTNIGAAQDKAIMINNGGGGTANTSGIGLDTTGAYMPNPDIGAGNTTSFKNGGYGSPYYNSFNGTGLLTWVKGSSSDAIYMNGQLPQPFGNTGTLGADTGNNWQICGAAAGSGFATSTYLTMTVYWVRFFNAALTAQQVAADYVGMSSIEAGNGFPVNIGATDQVAYHFAIGDSLTSGNGMTPYIALETLNNSMSATTRSAAGTKTTDWVPKFATFAPGMYRPSAPLSLFTIWLGTNDETTAVQSAGSNRQYCVQVHLLGPKCGIFTMISRNGSDAYAQALNPLLRGYKSAGYADVIVDLAADPLLAPNSNGGSSCYQAGGIHYTTACSQNDVVPIVNSAINSLYGNWDFGSAVTYSSAGGAAIATTAGSESTNTMTFTSAGWTAATFVKGTRMVCAGITPAGYNGVWQILSNAGTTVTAYNGTTGLGAITVQGTCQGEQLQQADNYAILNSGGNFLLSSCLDWVGRNVNLWNINGSSGTLVVFNSETFVGSTTVTTNAVAILSSVLTSNTAGGCKWVRLQ